MFILEKDLKKSKKELTYSFYYSYLWISFVLVRLSHENNKDKID